MDITRLKSQKLITNSPDLPENVLLITGTNKVVRTVDTAKWNQLPGELNYMLQEQEAAEMVKDQKMFKEAPDIVLQNNKHLIESLLYPFNIKHLLIIKKGILFQLIHHLLVALLMGLLLKTVIEKVVLTL